jgi:hypothetical protein
MGAPWLLGCGGMPDIALDGAAAHPVGTTMARASGALVEPALVDLPPKAGQLRWEEDVPMEVLWERRRMIPAADAAHQGKRKRSRSGIAAVPCTSSGCLVRMHHQHTRAAPPRGDGDMARKRKRVTDKRRSCRPTWSSCSRAITPLQPKSPSTTIGDFKDFQKCIEERGRKWRLSSLKLVPPGHGIGRGPFSAAVFPQSRRARRQRLCLA